MADGVGDDPAMILVAQALPHQLLRDTGGEVGDLAAQVIAGATDIGIELGLGRVDEALGLGAGPLDQARLFLAGLVPRLMAGPAGCRMRRTQPGRSVRWLAGGCGARVLRFL